MKRSEWDIVKSAFEVLTKKVNELSDKLDSLGKVIQTETGNGTIEDPIKGWTVGQKVEAGKWYLTSEGYLWEAIKSGNPSSETDNEYFDVVS